MSPESRALVGLSPAECVGLLGESSVGRVVFAVGGLPAIVPVTFAVDDGAIVMRTGADSKLARAADGGVLAFEVDDVDGGSRTGWSVVVTGVGMLVTDPGLRAGSERAVRPWAPGARDVVVRLPMSVVSGRRIVAVPADHAGVSVASAHLCTPTVAGLRGLLQPGIFVVSRGGSWIVSAAAVMPA